MNSKPIGPVKPHSMELFFFYNCPFCSAEIPLAAPTSPTMAFCDSCHQRFPIVPVDYRTMQFIRIMLQDGQAAIETAYL